jgi:hypothetical protein
MSRPFTWRGQMRRVSLLLIIMVIGLGAAFIFAIRPKSMAPPNATIFGPRLSILWAQMLKGSNTYYLPAGANVLGSGSGGLGSRLEGKLRQEIRKLGVGIDTLPAFRPGKGPGGRAFLICYTFPVPPTSSVHLDAELVARNGALFPLRNAAGGGGPPPERCWDLWTLDSLPSVVTNYALRLKLQTNGTPVAEIRFAEP